MKRKIAKHTFKNNKEISVGIVDRKDLPHDNFFLQVEDSENITTFYLRPDEVVLIAKLLNELILKRVISYEVNLGRKTKDDY